MNEELAYKDPADMLEAEERRTQLVDDVMAIQEQLTSRNREHEGVRLNSIEYHTWRRSAISALRHKQQDLRKINLWIKRQGFLRHKEEYDDVGTLLGIFDDYGLRERLGTDDLTVVEEIREHHNKAVPVSSKVTLQR